MMDLAQTYSDIAIGVSAQFGGPYVDGAVLGETPAAMVGGSIVTPGTPTERPCKVQIARADWAMRQAEGYVEGSMICLILVSTLDGDLDTDARVRVDGGPHAGTWLVSGLDKDSLGIRWRGTGIEA